MTRLLQVSFVAIILLILLNGCSRIEIPEQSGYNEIPKSGSFSKSTTESSLITNSSTSQIEQSSMKDQIQDSTPELSTYTNAFPKDGIPVLMYHSISTIPGNNLVVPVTQFEEEMNWLKSRNYTTLSLEDFYQALVHEKPVPQKPILLTFDDGYIDNYQDAWPILRQNGFRATFFIISNTVGSGMMTWEQIRELSDQGNTIANHTRTHPDLSTLSSKQIEKELSLSKKVLEIKIGRNIDALCFPSGRFNDRALEMMPNLGYKLGFTTKPGKVHLGDNPLTLKRVRIPGGMPFTAFKNQFP